MKNLMNNSNTCIHRFLLLLLLLLLRNVSDHEGEGAHLKQNPEHLFHWKC